MRQMFESVSYHLISNGTAHDEAVPPSVENRNLTDPAEIEQALRLGEYIKNGTHERTHPVYCTLLTAPGWHMAIIETLALYSLRKYRYLKQRYDSTGRDS
jgi:hypothetical protein